MATLPIHYVDLRAFCYATEEEPRVEGALRTFLPDEHPLERTESQGHYGDRIVVLSARVENADGIRHVLSKVRELADLDAVESEVDERVDEDCTFHLTLDKQDAFRGEVCRGAGITLRAKIEAYPAKRETAIANARTALEG